MTEPIFSSDPMMAAMQASLIAKTEAAPEPKETVVVPVTEPIVESKVETPVIPAVEPKTETPVVENIETKVVTPEVKEEPVVQKSFDETFLEKFENKYKSVDEIKALLDKPQVKFANEKIAHWNELAEKGIKIDKEFIELQSKDYENWTDAVEIELEAAKLLKPEYKGLNNDAIELLLEKKYSLSEWIEKDPSDYTADDKLNRALLERDSADSRDLLINYKNERILEKPIDPATLEAMAENERNEAIRLENWEKFVDSDLVNKVTKLSSPINDKGESFDYDISEKDLKEVSEIMKALPKDSNVFFGQFLEKDKDGNQVRNHQALMEMMLKARNYEKAVALAHADGIAKEALRAERESKNTNFKPAESGSGKPAPANLQEAMADAVRKQKL